MNMLEVQGCDSWSAEYIRGSRVEVDTEFLGLYGKLVNLDGSGPGDTQAGAIPQRNWILGYDCIYFRASTRGLLHPPPRTFLYVLS